MDGILYPVWQPTPKDVSSSKVLPKRIAFTWGGDLAAGAVLARSSGRLCEVDEVAIITHVFGLLSGTGGQTVVGGFIDVRNTPGQDSMVRLDHCELDPVGNVATRKLAWTGELAMFSDELIRIDGFFSAGVANNVVTAWVGGVIVPRGNWQRGKQ